MHADVVVVVVVVVVDVVVVDVVGVDVVGAALWQQPAGRWQ